MTPVQRASILNGGVLPFWNGLQTSRRGYSTGQAGFYNNNASSSLPLHPDYPTRFAGVFKSTFDVGFVPPTRNSTLDPPAVRSNPTAVTLLRPEPTGNRPLFSASSPYPVKHPFAEYLPMMRLANLTTMRSNVFAVRVTVGFFEFDPSTGLGQEYLENEGRSKRHSAFYVIDRSVPVGYREGQDLNTEKCVLMRRIIE